MLVEGTEEAGLLRFDRGRGAALVDLNLDGALDLVEIYLGARVGLWRNVTMTIAMIITMSVMPTAVMMLSSEKTRSSSAIRR